MTRLINFTRGEARALLHRLERGGYDYPAKARVELFVADLQLHAFVCVAGPARAATRMLDKQILSDAVTQWEGPPEAVRCLWNARTKIAAAFDVPPESIPFPQV